MNDAGCGPLPAHLSGTHHRHLYVTLRTAHRCGRRSLNLNGHVLLHPARPNTRVIGHYPKAGRMCITTLGDLRGYPLAPLRPRAESPAGGRRLGGASDARHEPAPRGSFARSRSEGGGEGGGGQAGRRTDSTLWDSIDCFLPTTVRQSLPNGSVVTQLFTNPKPCLVKAVASSASVMDRRYRTGAGP